MDATKKKQKIYAYFDESGQDDSSDFFIGIAIVSAKNQEQLRRQLDEVEGNAKTNKLKWHKTQHNRRMHYLSIVLEQRIATGDVYIAHYKKPLPFFFPMVYVLDEAIKRTAQGPYQASIYVDGIDQLKAKKLTNTLRARGISLRIVKSRRDESEPLIRLADMWAGCIRSALLHHKDAQEMLKRATKADYLHDLTT
jgi:uncharacterized protein DUF3800